MIDFRYHLVSLVSVFIALAIGVVLGAGPLRDSIGDTLSSQVDLLRDDRVQLQDQVTSLTSEVEGRDATIEALAPAAVDGALTGTRTVVLTLPGADADLAGELADDLEDAGGDVTGVVAVQQAWTDPDGADARRRVVASLPELALAPVAGEDPEISTALAAALAGSVTTPDAALVGTASATGTQVLDALVAADLVALRGDPSLRAGSALVVAPGGGSVAVTASADGAATVADADLGLLSALADTAGAVVLTSPEGAAPGTGLLAALRGDDLAATVSGVDDAGTAAGAVGVVLALREQVEGGAGQYGARSGDGGVLPPLPQGSTAAAEPPDDEPGQEDG
ncbi:copper transporter [Pseudokineococcus basanitobsidens]|uniref:Copper transporter n=1 Tax=Pseudokineococcus basanitobsidens TaxID=1926649 RepID=A0ABU8RN30_9ACTN